MARELRFIPPRSLVEVTTRTVQSRFLLRPSRDLNEIVIGVIARAKARYPVEVYAPVVVSNHLQALVCPDDAYALACFMSYINGNIAREANRLHLWSGPFWSRRFKAILVSNDEADQVAKLRYLLEHGVKENLVMRPTDWPGVHCAEALISGQPMQGLWYDRTAAFAARRRGERPGKYEYATPEMLELDPLPCWRDLPKKERQARAADLVQEIEAEARERHAKAGTRPLGVKQILRQHPHSVPKHTARSPAPRFHASRWEVWVCMKESYRQFEISFRQASNALRAGEAGVQFPPGSFPPGLPFVRGSPPLLLP